MSLHKKTFLFVPFWFSINQSMRRRLQQLNSIHFLNFRWLERIVKMGTICDMFASSFRWPIWLCWVYKHGELDYNCIRAFTLNSDYSMTWICGAALSLGLALKALYDFSISVQNVSASDKPTWYCLKHMQKTLFNAGCGAVAATCPQISRKPNRWNGVPHVALLYGAEILS